MKRHAPLTIVLAALVAACSESSTAETATDTTETPWWVLIIVAVGLAVVVVMVVRRGSPPTPERPPGGTWKSNAQDGYVQARWLYDAMGEDLAVWRGNEDPSAAVEATALASANTATWNELASRMDACADALYRLDAHAPDPRSAAAAQATIAAAKATRDALDVRASARAAYRALEAQGASTSELSAARDREVRASRGLSEARRALSTALEGLSEVA
jgi:hypothetical protein